MSENVQVQLIDECYNCFNDGVTKIGEEIVFSRELIDVEWKAFLDYILVYEDKRATTIDELAMNIAPPVNNEENDKITLELQKQKNRHRMFKRRFLVNLAKVGLVMETVDFEEISLE